MALRLDDGSTLKIIDRTILEICSSGSKASRLDIISFCWLLKEAGVDVIEIDASVIERLGKLPKGIDFLYRIDKLEDRFGLAKSGVKDCIICAELLKNEVLMGNLGEQGINGIVEFISERMVFFPIPIPVHQVVKGVRLMGLSTECSMDWVEQMRRIKVDTGLLVDICPDNRYHTATALAVEAVMGGADAVTVSFAGYGSDISYAPFEEVMAAVKVLIKPVGRISLELLPRMAKYFKFMTRLSISSVKPIIGSDIFVYESGIHADGISKNPSTYEPFDPSIVGMERRAAIGKHTGSRALLKKLRELGLNCTRERSVNMLGMIRKRSIEVKRALYDYEIREIFEVSS